MSSKIFLAAGLSLTIFLVLVVAAFVIHTSAAFLWGMVTEAPLAVFLEGRPENIHLLAFVQDHYHLAANLPFAGTDTVRFVYAPGSHVVIFPHLQKNAAVLADLKQQGWQARRLGLLIVGVPKSDTAPVLPQTRALLGNGVRGFWVAALQGLPLRPAALALTTPERLPALPQPSRILAIRQGEEIAVAAVFARELPSAWPKIKSLPPDATSAAFFASLPGHVLKLLPKNLQETGNTFFRGELAISHTRPDIIGTLANLERVLIKTGGGTTLAGRDSQENVAGIFEEWLRTERAYATPITRAFRLPDGTLGYEKHPGEPENVFARAPEGNECVASQNWSKLVRVCQQNNLVALTTQADPPTAAEVEVGDPDSWHFTVAAPFTSRLELGLTIATISAWGSRSEANVVITMAPQP